MEGFDNALTLPSPAFLLPISPFFFFFVTLLGFRPYFKHRLKPSVLISPADKPAEGLAGRVADAG